MKKKMRVNEGRKLNIIKKITNFIENDDKILFSYIFGSFVENDEFSDIDIGVYTKDAADINLEFELENEIEKMVNIPVDVRIINNAPVPFAYNVIKNGIVIKENDERTDFEVYVLKAYFDYVHLREEYLKEATYA